MITYLLVDPLCASLGRSYLVHSSNNEIDKFFSLF
jgi:hypothetical protein